MKALIFTYFCNLLLLYSCGYSSSKKDVDVDYKQISNFFETENITLEIAPNKLSGINVVCIVENSPIVKEESESTNTKRYSPDFIGSLGSLKIMNSFSSVYFQNNDSIYLIILTNDYQYNYSYNTTDLKFIDSCSKIIPLFFETYNTDKSKALNYINENYVGLSGDSLKSFIDEKLVKNSVAVATTFVGFVVDENAVGILYNINRSDNSGSSFLFTFVRNNDYRICGFQSP